MNRDFFVKYITKTFKVRTKRCNIKDVMDRIIKADNRSDYDERNYRSSYFL